MENYFGKMRYSEFDFYDLMKKNHFLLIKIVWKNRKENTTA